MSPLSRFSEHRLVAWIWFNLLMVSVNLIHQENFGALLSFGATIPAYIDLQLLTLQREVRHRAHTGRLHN